MFIRCRMRIVNIQEAKTQLSKLVDRAADAEPFIIYKAGKPMVNVVPLEMHICCKVKRVGFMAGQIMVPDDFDRMGQEKIKQLFGSCQ